MLKPTLIFNGGEWRDLRKTPRMFAPLNPYDHTQCHWTHAMRLSGEPDGDGPYESVAADVLNACAAWDKLGTFAERNARKERKSCGTITTDGSAETSALTSVGKQSSSIAPSPTTQNGAISPKSPSSPLASDGPESRGWKKSKPSDFCWQKNQIQLWHEPDGTWWAAKDPNHETGHEHRMLSPSGFTDFLPGGKAYRFHDWQTPDALLFPAHEWAVGDEVECLDVVDFGTCIKQKSIIKRIAKHPFWNPGGENLCAIFAGGRHHPISALRLIKAAERTTK